MYCWTIGLDYYEGIKAGWIDSWIIMKGLRLVGWMDDRIHDWMIVLLDNWIIMKGCLAGWMFGWIGLMIG